MFQILWCTVGCHHKGSVCTLSYLKEYDKRVGRNVHMVMAVCFASLSVKLFFFVLYYKLSKKQFILNLYNILCVTIRHYHNCLSCLKSLISTAQCSNSPSLSCSKHSSVWDAVLGSGTKVQNLSASCNSYSGVISVENICVLFVIGL